MTCQYNLLEAARRAAQDALLDRTLFTMRPKAFAEFVRRLDAPPRPKARLRRALRCTVALDEMSGGISPPEPLGETHRIDELTSSEPVRDEWLRRRARAHQASRAS